MSIKKSRGKNGTRLRFLHLFASRVGKVGFNASEEPFSHFLGQLISPNYNYFERLRNGL